MTSDAKIDILDHSLKVGMGKLLRKVMESDPKRKKHGCLSKMLTTSKALKCEWIASSFCEKVDSVANQVFIKGNSLLLPDEIDTLATLCVGREFVQLMRDSYSIFSLKNFQDFMEEKEEAQCTNLSNACD